MRIPRKKALAERDNAICEKKILLEAADGGCGNKNRKIYNLQC